MTRPGESTRHRVVARLRNRLTGLGREAGKFAAVGATTYLVDTGLFNLAHYGWHMHTVSAKILSTVAAATLAFVGNRLWTWRSRPRRGLRREYVRYFGFNAVGLGITLLSVWAYQVAVAWWPHVLDNPIALNLIVNVFGVGAASLFRFYAYRTWVFRPEHQPGAHDR